LTLVLYGVSPIGLGHASRGVAVGQELEAAGVEVVFASGGNAASHLSSYGMNVRDVIREPVPAVRGGEMKNASLWYLRYWSGYRRSKAAMAALMKSLEPDLVVGDEEFSGVSLALEAKRPHALIADELQLGFARSALARYVEVRVESWYSRLQQEVEALIVPDFGADGGNRHHVGPIVRPVTSGRAQLSEEYSLPAEGFMILLSMSGSGIGDYLLRRTLEAFRRMAVPGAFLVIAGNRGRTVAGDRVFDLGTVRDGQNLVASADLVVSTAGKSTIDEASSAGTPLIAIPIKNHPEQERNAESAGYGPADLSRLEELMAERMGHREEPRNYAGAARTARLLMSLRASGALPSTR